MPDVVPYMILVAVVRTFRGPSMVALSAPLSFSLSFFPSLSALLETHLLPNTIPLTHAPSAVSWTLILRTRT